MPVLPVQRQLGPSPLGLADDMLWLVPRATAAVVLHFQLLWDAQFPLGPGRALLEAAGPAVADPVDDAAVVAGQRVPGADAAVEHLAAAAVVGADADGHIAGGHACRPSQLVLLAPMPGRQRPGRQLVT